MKGSKRKLKGVARLLLAVTAVFVVFMVFIACSNTAFATTIVRTIKIYVDGNGDYSYPTISTSNAGYEITDWGTWSKKEENLNVGDKITCTITVEPTDGYEIRLDDGKNDVTVRGDGDAKLESYSRSGSKFKLRISYIVSGELDTPEDAYWDESRPWIATTEKVSGAKKYEYQLYRGSTRIKTAETSSRTYNFIDELITSSVAEKSEVHFRVRAIYGSGSNVDKSDWTYSDELDDDDWNEIWWYCNDHNLKWKGKSTSSSSSSSSNHSSSGGPGSSPASPASPAGPSYGRTGWEGGPGNWYYYMNGSLVRNDWVWYKNHWYYFSGDGRMLTGWQQVGGRWYYLYPATNEPQKDLLEGACVADWWQIDGNYYYFWPSDGYDSNGRFHKANEMAANVWIGNYYVNAKGVWSSTK